MSQNDVKTPQSHGEWRMLVFSVMLAKLFGWNLTAVLLLMIYNCVTMTSSVTWTMMTSVLTSLMTAMMTTLASIKDTLYELYKFKLCWNKLCLKIQWSTQCHCGSETIILRIKQKSVVWKLRWARCEITNGVVKANL